MSSPWVEHLIEFHYPDYQRLFGEGDPQLFASLIPAIEAHLKDCPPGMRWGWKLSETGYALPLFARLFPEAWFIHLVRDGRDLAFSHFRAPDDAILRKAHFGDEGVLHLIQDGRERLTEAVFATGERCDGGDSGPLDDSGHGGEFGPLRREGNPRLALTNRDQTSACAPFPPRASKTMHRRSSAEFLALTHPIDTHRWELKVDQTMTGGMGSLFGGVGLAAGIVALEQATGKPVVWATGQYLSITQQPVTIDLEVHLPAKGRNVTQGRVVGHVGEREIITVIGAVGERPPVASGCWVEFPTAAPPMDCPEVPRDPGPQSLHHHIEIRLARGAFGFNMFGEPTTDGRSLLWARLRDVEHDAAALGIIADYMPSVLGNALGRLTHCTAWTTPSASRTGGRRSGSCATTGWSSSATASATARCIFGASTAFCLRPAASRSSCACRSNRNAP